MTREKNNLKLNIKFYSRENFYLIFTSLELFFNIEVFVQRFDVFISLITIISELLLATYSVQKSAPLGGMGAGGLETIFSTHRMYIIRCALDLCDPGTPFEYLKHVCDVKNVSYRLV